MLAPIAMLLFPSPEHTLLEHPVPQDDTKLPKIAPKVIGACVPAVIPELPPVILVVRAPADCRRLPVASNEKTAPVPQPVTPFAAPFVQLVTLLRA